MKTVLATLNAKFIHSSLALRSIQAYGRKMGEFIDIAEFTINHEENYILRELYKQKPDIVGFSCYIWNIKEIMSIVKSMKKVFPQLIIFLGGPEVSYDSESVLENCVEVDYIIKGEGEQTVYELLQHLKHGTKSLENIQGVVYRQEHKIITTLPRTPLDLADIPFAYGACLDDLQHRIIYYESSRGCPYQCQYCLSSVEKGVRFLSLSRVFSDLQIFLNQGVRQVKFVDRTFNCKKSHAWGIWRYLVENDNNKTNFHFEISADLLDDEILDFLSTVRPGLFQFEIGIQTTNLDTIEYIQRNMSFETIKKYVKRLRMKGNIHQHLDLIAGLPGEDYASFARSFNDVYALFPEQLQLGFLKLLKGSGLRVHAQQYGLVYKEQAPYEILYTKEINYEEMLMLKMIEEMVEIYYNSRKFKYTLHYIIPKFESAFLFFEELARFWEDHKYHEVQHNKMQLYTFLWNFCTMKRLEDMDIIRDLLKFDLYVQEKVKNLPDFLSVGEQNNEKDKIRGFYQNQDNIQRYLPELLSYNSKQISRMCQLEIFAFEILQWIASSFESINMTATPILFDYYAKDELLGHASFYKVFI